MADFHAADLWVAVVPETSQVGPAMEKAGKEAKGKFGDAIKGIGKSVHSEIDDVGKHAKDAFGKAGKMAGEVFSSEIGKELTNSAAKEIGGAIGGAVRELPGVARGVELFQQWGSATKVATQGIQGFGDAMRSAKAGDFAGSLEGVGGALRTIEPIAKDFGVDIQGWPENLDTIAKRFGDTSTNVSDTAKSLKTFTDQAGPASSGMKAFGEAALAASGPIGITVAIAEELDKALTSLNVAKFTEIPGGALWFMHQLGNGWKDVKSLFGMGGGSSPTGTTDANGQPLFRSGTTGGSQMPDNPTDEWDPKWGPRPAGGGLGWFGKGRPLPALAPTDMPDGAPSLPSVPRAPISQAPMPPMPSPGSGGGSGGGGGIAGSGLSSRVLGGANSPQGLRAAGGQVANLLAFAESLAGTPYSQALRNDCSGMVAKLANVALGLPPVASFSTVNEGDWLMSHGFEPGLGGPNDLNIGWYDHGGGNAGHTAATLPGGIHAESGGSHGNFLLGSGAAGADNPEFSQHAHLSMGNFRASSLGDSGGIGGQMPTGAEHDPLYVTNTGPGGSSASSPFEGQGQQLGQGLLSGLMQSIGLDGSVFGGKSPLDWGAVKLGGGLLNYGMGLAKSMGGGPMGAPGMGSGGGGLGGLAGLIPSPGAMISAAVGPGGGSLGIGQTAGVSPQSVHYDNRTIVSGNEFGKTADMVQQLQWNQNAKVPGSSGRTDAYLSQPAT